MPAGKKHTTVNKLTPKQARFVQEYLIDFNGTDAAIRSGYSKRSARVIAQTLLAKPHIAAAVAKARDKVSQKLEVTVERIVREAAAVAFSDLRELYDDKGQLLPVHLWPAGVAESIAGVEVEELFEGRGDEREHVGRLKKIKRWDKVRALELLARYKGMFVDQVKLSVDDSLLKPLADAIRRAHGGS